MSRVSSACVMPKWQTRAQLKGPSQDVRNVCDRIIPQPQLDLQTITLNKNYLVLVNCSWCTRLFKKLYITLRAYKYYYWYLFNKCITLCPSKYYRFILHYKFITYKFEYYLMYGLGSIPSTTNKILSCFSTKVTL